MIHNIVFFHLIYISICRFKIIEEAVIAFIAPSLIGLSNPNLEMAYFNKGISEASYIFDHTKNCTTITIHI